MASKCFFPKSAVRSRLSRRRCLRPKRRWKPLDEIYKFHILLVTLISNFRKFLIFANFRQDSFFQKIVKARQNYFLVIQNCHVLSIKFQNQRLNSLNSLQLNFNFVSNCSPSAADPKSVCLPSRCSQGAKVTNHCEAFLSSRPSPGL